MLPSDTFLRSGTEVDHGPARSSLVYLLGLVALATAGLVWYDPLVALTSLRPLFVLAGLVVVAAGLALGFQPIDDAGFAPERTARVAGRVGVLALLVLILARALPVPAWLSDGALAALAFALVHGALVGTALVVAPVVTVGARSPGEALAFGTPALLGVLAWGWFLLFSPSVALADVPLLNVLDLFVLATLLAALAFVGWRGVAAGRRTVARSGG